MAEKKYGDGFWFLKMKPKEYAISLGVSIGYVALMSWDIFLPGHDTLETMAYVVMALFLYKTCESFFYQKLAMWYRTFTDDFSLIFFRFLYILLAFILFILKLARAGL